MNSNKAALILFLLSAMAIRVESGRQYDCGIYWMSKLNCKCLEGCMQCGDFMRNYNINLCITECQKTKAEIVDQYADPSKGCYVGLGMRRPKPTRRQRPRPRMWL